MTIVYGAPILVNTQFDSLSGIVNSGMDTWEIVSGQLHLIGNTGDRSRHLVQQPAYNPPELIVLRGQFTIISGNWRINSGYNLSPNYRFWQGGPGSWSIPVGVPRLHIAPSDWYLDITALSDGAEAYFEFLDLNLVLSGGTKPVSYATYRYIDYDRDRRQFTLNITDADAASHDARLAQVGALGTAIDGITQCNRESTDFLIDRAETGAAPPTAPAAQVNIEWLVRYVDNVTGSQETLRIPGADLTLAGVLLPGSNVADLTQTQMAAFVTAFEAVVNSAAGNAVSISSVEFLE